MAYNFTKLKEYISNAYDYIEEELYKSGRLTRIIAHSETVKPDTSNNKMEVNQVQPDTSNNKIEVNQVQPEITKNEILLEKNRNSFT